MEPSSCHYPDFYMGQILLNSQIRGETRQPLGSFSGGACSFQPILVQNEYPHSPSLQDHPMLGQCEPLMYIAYIPLSVKLLWVLHTCVQEKKKKDEAMKLQIPGPVVKEKKP